MKKIIASMLTACILSGCESFLDTENLTKKDNSNFPLTTEDAQMALTGAYTMLRQTTDGAEGQCFFITSEILSDDRLGGGGPDDRAAQAVNQLKKSADNMFADPWRNAYKGIFRCNMLLESITNITTWESEAVRKQILAETHFLRAYFYFDLCRLFGTVPLITATAPVNNPRATPDELYALIASDLQTAIDNFPSTKIQEMPISQLGHATKWAAQGLLARVYLFYTGYYKKEALPSANGKSISKQEVIAQLDDCIANSGHALLPDFRNLWPYSNKLTQPGYKYSIDNNLSWVGEAGANTETMFAIRFGATADWGPTSDYNNSPNLFFSIREQPTDGIYPFGLGWGYGPANSRLWEEWSIAEPNDIRREASILNVENPNEGLAGYKFGGDKQWEETGYWQKKYIAVNARKEDKSIIGYSHLMYGAPADYMLNNTQDLVMLRFADVLLMAAELKEDATPLNLVRARAGLPAVAYSTQALRNERHWELAFEAIRYYDILRWGIAGEELSKQNGVSIKNNLVEGKMNVGNIAKRIEETGGFLQIPQTQIDLSNGVLTQTPGWTGSSIIY